MAKYYRYRSDNRQRLSAASFGIAQNHGYASVATGPNTLLPECIRRLSAKQSGRSGTFRKSHSLLYLLWGGGDMWASVLTAPQERHPRLPLLLAFRFTHPD